MTTFDFDGKASAIAALHSNRELRSICHEQIVSALREVKNTACDADHCTPEERAVIEAALTYISVQDDYSEGVTEDVPPFAGLYDTYCDAARKLRAARAKKGEVE